MPHKFNAKRRHKFAAARYRVTNWPDYNEALRRRRDVMFWFDDGVASAWRAQRRKDRGGQPVYSDVAIEVCLTLRSVFRLPLRQAQGLVRSLLRLMELALPTPDFSTFSRRSKRLKIVQDGSGTDSAITLIVDSTGLKIHSGTGWCADKHGADKTRKSWRKLHIGIDHDTDKGIDKADNDNGIDNVDNDNNDNDGLPFHQIRAVREKQKTGLNLDIWWGKQQSRRRQ